MNTLNSDEPQNQSPEEDSIFLEILKLTNEQFDAGRVLLLAQVGQFLQKRGFDIKSSLGSKKLSSYISENMKEQVKIVVSPTDKLVHGIIPINASIEGKESQYFGLPTKENKIEIDAPRFDRGVWRAFSQPLEDGHERKICISPTIFYKDIKIGSQLGDNFFTIEHSDITLNSLDRHLREDSIIRKIKEWADRNKISINELRESRNQPHDFNENRQPHSLLNAILSSLNEDDLRRIVIPMDIVKKLHSKNS
ncbi:hypothetical protein [Delftia lacustris]|uniref:hypothetical protein n=1 Tax=Delftia lacustris TaxID=558537 RepID=UPI0035A60CA3